MRSMVSKYAPGSPNAPMSDLEKRICDYAKVFAPVVTLYPYGSRVYGTHDEKSDRDYVVVLSDNSELVMQEVKALDGADLQIYSYKTFKRLLDNHDLMAIECYSWDFARGTPRFDYDLDLGLLRRDISARVSNSWVKAKKKIEVEREYRLGIKSLFHSFRMLYFGKQIAKYKRVVDFTEANHIWTEIQSHGEQPWEFWKDLFQQRHNQLSTEFRLLAPKETDD
jgi:predicted nucleotidyltransferase